jgi:hypothetical protein
MLDVAMTKPWREKELERDQRDEGNAIASGKHFRVQWSRGGLSYGPIYFGTLTEAEARRDAMISENEIPTPADYFGRQCHRVLLGAGVESYVDGAWIGVGGSRQCLVSVEYAD